MRRKIISALLVGAIIFTPFSISNSIFNSNRIIALAETDSEEDETVSVSTTESEKDIKEENEVEKEDEVETDTDAESKNKIETTETDVNANTKDETDEVKTDTNAESKNKIETTETDVNANTKDETDEVKTETETTKESEAKITYKVYVGDEEVDSEKYIDCNKTYNIGGSTFTCIVDKDYTITDFELDGEKYEYDDFNEDANSFTYDISIKNKMNITIHLISYAELNSITETNSYDSDNSSNDKYYASSKGNNITIDGYFDDWNDKPLTYHYNWDNSQNCWNWGEWVDDVCYKTPEGTYDNNVRHAIQLYENDGYIFVHIKIATIYQSRFNGEDYNFTFNDSQGAKFQITDTNGKVITGNVDDMKPGIYNVQVRHGNGSCSFQLAESSSACLRVYDNHRNTEIEFALPISECHRQNTNIDTENVESIDFFTPNLMYTHIQSHGTPTYPIPLAIICASIVIAGNVYFIKKRKQKRRDA